jgi:site-specific DNA recombinase
MLGVTRQLADCTAVAMAKGWPIAEHYCDDDLSAYSGKARPAYRRLLQDLRDRRIDGVVVYALDRLHRQPRELEEFLDVCLASNVTHLANATGEVDLGTDDGQLFARILSAMNKKESDDKGRRLKRKHLEIAQAGRWAGGTRAYGYATDRTIAPSEAAIIREAVARVLAGETLRGVTTDLNKRGIATVTGAKWSTTVVRRMLMSPGLSGQRTLHGQVVSKAVWEPILTPHETARLSTLFSDPARRVNRSARRYLLTGLLHCALCGAKLVARPRADKRRCYVCATGPGFHGCGKIRILSDTLEEFVAEAVLYRLDSPELTQAMRTDPDADRNASDLEIKIAEDQAQLEELAGSYAAREITLAEWLLARHIVETRQEASKAAFARLDRHAALRSLSGQSDRLRSQWADLNLDRRRAVITTLLDRVSIHPGIRGLNRFDPRRIEPLWRV